VHLLNAIKTSLYFYTEWLQQLNVKIIKRKEETRRCGSVGERKNFRFYILHFRLKTENLKSSLFEYRVAEDCYTSPLENRNYFLLG